MNHLPLTLALLASLAFAAPASADEPDEESSASDQPEGEVRYKERTEIDFRERKVGGVMTGPMGVYSESLAEQQWNPLIRLKTNFEAEILASVDAIR